MRDLSFTGPHAVVRRWLLSARVRAPYDVYAGKREHPRYPWDRTVDLKTRDRVIRVCGHDISRSGLGVVCMDQLIEGERIAVRYHPMEAWVPGVIVHATRTNGAVTVGIALKFDADLSA